MKNQRGSVLCNRCGIAMNTGTCPRCGGVTCHISLFWKGNAEKFYKDKHEVVLSHMAAVEMRFRMNIELKERRFRPENWRCDSRSYRMDKLVYSWIQECAEEVKAGEMSPAMPIFYRSISEKHILNPEYGLGSWFIQDIGVQEIKAWAKRLPQKLLISTRRQIVHTFHVFFKWAYKSGIIREIPAFPTIKGNNSRPRLALDIPTQYEALDKIPDVHKDIFEWGFETGCRPGETCALKIKDFDFTNKTVIIRRTFTMCKLRESDKEGHKKAIPLSERAFTIAKNRAAGRFPDEWLFVNPKGQHYTAQNLNELWKKYSGIPTTHYEATRHSFCTQIVEVADKKAAQGLMRHASPMSTDRYFHSRTEYLRDHLKKRNNIVEMKRKERK